MKLKELLERMGNDNKIVIATYNGRLWLWYDTVHTVYYMSECYHDREVVNIYLHGGRDEQLTCCEISPDTIAIIIEGDESGVI